MHEFVQVHVGLDDLETSDGALTAGAEAAEEAAFGTALAEVCASLARQIAGRAGRYGVHEEGLVAGYDEETHKVMRELLREKPVPLKANQLQQKMVLKTLK